MDEIANELEKNAAEVDQRSLHELIYRMHEEREVLKYFHKTGANECKSCKPIQESRLRLPRRCITRDIIHY